MCLELGCSEGCPEVTWQPLPLNLHPCQPIFEFLIGFVGVDVLCFSSVPVDPSQT